MQIPKRTVASLCGVGVFWANIVGLAIATISLRPIHSVVGSTYGELAKQGFPPWTVLGVAFGVYLLYGARTSRGTFEFSHLGFGYLGKHLFVTIAVASGVWFAFHRSLGRGDVFQIRSGVICAIGSVIFALVVPIATQNTLLWIWQFPDWLSRHKPSKARLISQWQSSDRWIHSLSFYTDGRTLISSGDDGSVRFWDLEGNAARSLLKVEATDGAFSCSTYSVISPDGSRLATSALHSVKLWDYETGELLWEHSEGDMSPSCIVFSQDGTRMVSASHSYGSEPTGDKVSLLDSENGQALLSEYAKYEVYGQSTSAGQTGISDGGYSVAEVRRKEKQVGCEVKGVAFSPDGREVCYVGGKTEYGSDQSSNSVGLLGGFADGYNWSSAPYAVEVNAIATSPSGKCAIAFVQGPVLLANNVVSLNSTKTSKELLGHRGGAWGLAFSPNGKFIAGAFGDATVRIWDTESGALVCTLLVQREKKTRTQATAVAFSADGKYLAAGNLDGGVFVWDVQGVGQ